MEQLERIAHMEQALDTAAAAIAQLSEALEAYDAAREALAELEEYSRSGQWLRDYDDDCAGKLPTGLKRGVLSQDALYDLLSENDTLRRQLLEAGKHSIPPAETR